MELMQPVRTDKIEPNADWLYEMKYDGFRATLSWTVDEIKIISRNNVDLTSNFPEVIRCCRKYEENAAADLPVRFDGELVVLNNRFQANFSAVQQRGRLKDKAKIDYFSHNRPATFIVFDLLLLKNISQFPSSLLTRKKYLHHLFEQLQVEDGDCLQLIHTYNDYDEMKRNVFTYKGEGIVAKRKSSTYISGKNHRAWLKEKNWREIQTTLTSYDSKNDYYTVEVIEERASIPIGKCKHGLPEEDRDTLKKLFITNGKKNGDTYILPPAICASIHTLDLYKSELREPEFSQLLPQTKPEECTIDRLQLDLAMLPEVVNISNVDKIFWPMDGLTKGDLLVYMREIYPYMYGHLKNRALTVIRCPDGIREDSFFQKNLPSYAPDFIDVIEESDKRIQLCNSLASLIWFANHSAIEYHTPFQPVYRTMPSEIVFDLDPPDKEAFSLAVKASLLIKQLLDELQLISFIKTSGNKGLQIHIPISDQISYDQTAIFTEAIAKTVERAEPALFTTERFKKNRGKRLYIDYVQHGKNKTIIAPYSPRKTEEATVATPLYWKEVKPCLRPGDFTITNVVNRVQRNGCPWFFAFEKAREQKLAKVFELIESYR